jgi:hypothetical protein
MADISLNESLVESGAAMALAMSLAMSPGDDDPAARRRCVGNSQYLVETPPRKDTRCTHMACLTRRRVYIPWEIRVVRIPGGAARGRRGAAGNGSFNSSFSQLNREARGLRAGAKPRR